MHSVGLGQSFGFSEPVASQLIVSNAVSGGCLSVTVGGRTAGDPNIRALRRHGGGQN